MTIPSDLSGLVGWWKADAISGVDGDPIGTWPDSSGGSHDLTQATGTQKPTLKTGIINSLPVARFDGGDIIVNSAFDLSATDKATVFAVLKATSAATAQVFLEHGVNTNTTNPGFGFYIAGQTANNIQAAVGKAAGGIAARSTTVSPGTVFNILAAVYDRALTGAQQATPRLNGIAISVTDDATNDVTGNFGNVSLNVGARSGVAAPFTGDIAELIIYNRVLSDSELNQIGGYGSSRYALPWVGGSLPERSFPRGVLRGAPRGVA